MKKNKVSQWDLWLEDGSLIDITKRARKVSSCPFKVGLTNNLYKKLAPYAEEANKGIDWEERIYDLMKGYHSHAQFSVGGEWMGLFSQVDFDLKIETNVKEVHSYDEIETFKNSKKVTEVIPVYGTPDRDD